MCFALIFASCEAFAGKIQPREGPFCLSSRPESRPSRNSAGPRQPQNRQGELFQGRLSIQDRRRLLQIRLLLGFFIAALILSGLTAFPLRWELRLLNSWFGEQTPAGAAFPGLAQWLSYVQEGLESTGRAYPFLAYGTDWLAFAHLMIAIAFFGPLKDPVKNIWVVEFGMIACLSVIPLALVCGQIRGIPFTWRLLDCSFGVFGMIPLIIVRRLILKMRDQEFPH